MGFVIENGILTNYIEEPDVTEIIIPEEVTAIGDYAFSKIIFGGADLTSVIIPGSVTSIGRSAFEQCRKLKNITISNGVANIGDCAFYECKSLTSIELPDSVTSIGSCAFWGCEKLESVVISHGIKSIGDRAFCGCESLSSVAIPDGVTSISPGIFLGCERLANIVIPNGVTSIGYNAFGGCSRLMNITIPDSVTVIGDSSFSRCSLTSITIPDSVTSVGQDLFDGDIQICLLPSNLAERFYTGDWGKCEGNFAIIVTDAESFFALSFSSNGYDNNIKGIRQGDWKEYDSGLCGNSRFKIRMPARLLGMLSRLETPTLLSDDAEATFVSYLTSNARKLIPLAEETHCPDIVTIAIKHGVINNTNKKAIKKRIAISHVPEIAALSNLDSLAYM